VKKVRVYLFQCRDLPAADSDGQSDPYVVLWDTGKETIQTKVIDDNINPLFYETHELQIEANKIDDMPPFVFDIYDKDYGPLDGDDFICRALINVNEANYSEDNQVPRPKWHPCRLKQGAPAQGEILLSFSIVDDDFTFDTPLAYKNLMEETEFKEFKIEINILGLRNLQSVGLLPVKKAFISFNLKSLIPPNDKQALENIKTQPGPLGPNPTINTAIQFNMPLPTDELFCPRLGCSVYDNIFKGFMQPLIGTFTIPVGDVLRGKREKRDKELSNLDFIIDQLEKIMKDQAPVSYSIQGGSFSEDLDFREK